MPMTRLFDWFHTPPGQYALAWEQAQFDAALVDVFGYHAVQLGLPALDALRANRMPHRWHVALDAGPGAAPPASPATPGPGQRPAPEAPANKLGSPTASREIMISYSSLPRRVNSARETVFLYLSA